MLEVIDVLVPRRTNTTDPIDKVHALVAFAQHGVEIEMLVETATVAVVVRAASHVVCRVASGTVSGSVEPCHRSSQQCEQQNRCFEHGGRYLDN